MMCNMLDTRNAALSIRQMSDVSHIPEVDKDQFEHTETQGSMTITELRGTDISVPGRPEVSTQDILANYQSLRSGAESDIMDPTPARLHTLSSAIVPSSHPMESPTVNLEPPSSSSAHAPPVRLQETISRLQRENLLLRTELNGAPWLTHGSVKGKGRLYEDRILVKGTEVERQGLVSWTSFHCIHRLFYMLPV